MPHTHSYTITEFIAAMERELIKRSTTYPRIVAKKQRANVSTEEIMDIVATQRIQYELLKDAVAALMHRMDMDPGVSKAIHAELLRELKMRKKSYPRWVYLKRMKPEIAEYETDVWAALVQLWKESYIDTE